MDNFVGDTERKAIKAKRVRMVKEKMVKAKIKEIFWDISRVAGNSERSRKATPKVRVKSQKVRARAKAAEVKARAKAI